MPVVKSNDNRVLPGIKASVNYKPYHHIEYNPYVFDINFIYKNEKQAESMVNKYVLSAKYDGCSFYSNKKAKVAGIIANSEKELNQLLTEFIENDNIDVTVGNTIIGGKYDEDAKKIVEIEIAEMKRAEDERVELEQAARRNRARSVLREKERA